MRVNFVRSANDLATVNVTPFSDLRPDRRARLLARCVLHSGRKAEWNAQPHALREPKTSGVE
jgi:hypothetical protein